MKVSPSTSVDGGIKSSTLHYLSQAFPGQNIKVSSQRRTLQRIDDICWTNEPYFYPLAATG